jgi:DNA invertase Pin-like site-specific DNA recombinase
MTKKAIALYRVSTYKQSVEGHSLDAQAAKVARAAEYLEAEIVRHWRVDASSRIGKNLRREDLKEALAYCKANKIAYFIIDEVDRFMRSIKEYYWYQIEFEKHGVKLIFASQPELNDEGQFAKLRELLAIYEAEASNAERSRKTNDKMEARLAAGFYPGVIKPGYKKSETPGIQRPLEPQWSLLRQAFIDVLSGVPLKDANRLLNDRGYKTRSNNKMDLFNLKKILVDPYYCGTVQMSKWSPNPNGLHKAMITKDQHETVLQIVSGVKHKRRHKVNPDFKLSNKIECTECLAVNVKFPRLVGYAHHNGKVGNKRKFYRRYRCRNCGANILRDVLHEAVSKELLNVKIADEKLDDFLAALRAVWEEDESISISRLKTLQVRLEQLRDSKNKLVIQAANGTIAEEDVEEALVEIKRQIYEVEQEISSVKDTEKDFTEFVAFTMKTIDGLQDDFWELDDEHMGWCKQLLFPEGFSVSRDKKVYTPVLSDFYRLATIQKDPTGSSKSTMVGDRGVEPLTSTTSMWRSSQLS